jgi:hypothetical protein
MVLGWLGGRKKDTQLYFLLLQQPVRLNVCCLGIFIATCVQNIICAIELHWLRNSIVAYYVKKDILLILVGSPALLVADPDGYLSYTG